MVVYVFSSSPLGYFVYRFLFRRGTLLHKPALDGLELVGRSLNADFQCSMCHVLSCSCSRSSPETKEACTRRRNLALFTVPCSRLLSLLAQPPPFPPQPLPETATVQQGYRASISPILRRAPGPLPGDPDIMTESDAKPVVLKSRWGLAPVVIDDCGSRQRGTSPSGDDDEDEPTGRVLWDCAQILWDLLADPDPRNKYAVRGKVGLQDLTRWLERGEGHLGVLGYWCRHDG